MLRASHRSARLRILRFANQAAGSSTAISPVSALARGAAQCARRGVRATVRLYDRLFRDAAPDRDVERLAEQINPDSLEVLESSVVEPSLALAEPGEHFQFERLGYFVADSGDHRPGTPVFNRTVTLRDTWSRQQKKGSG